MNPAEAYILGQEEPYRTLLLHLQVLIEQSVPGATLRFRYRIPFYYLWGKPFCYLNKARDYVDLGFYRGTCLTRHTELMECRGRKTVKSLRYRRPEEIDPRVLIEVLSDAVEVQSRS